MSMGISEWLAFTTLTVAFVAALLEFVRFVIDDKSEEREQ